MRKALFFSVLFVFFWFGSRDASAFTQAQCVSFGLCFDQAFAACVGCNPGEQCGPDPTGGGVLGCRVYNQSTCMDIGLCYIGGGACGSCPDGQYCSPSGECKAETQCGTPTTQCGSLLGNSGKHIDCGSCSDGQVCLCTNDLSGINNCLASSCCQPLTCADVPQIQCGSTSDGCGGTITCGPCGDNQTCQGNTCCTSKSCSDLNYACGITLDVCTSASLNCGSCPASQKCMPNHTCCQPLTCDQVGQSCGEMTDGCGGIVQCPNLCSFFGKTCYKNECCIPLIATCQDRKYQCGGLNDNCGGMKDCGGCPQNQHCDNNHQCIAGGAAAVPAMGSFAEVSLGGILLLLGVFSLKKRKKTGMLSIVAGLVCLGSAARAENYHLCCDLSERPDGTCVSQPDECAKAKDYAVSLTNLLPACDGSLRADNCVDAGSPYVKQSTIDSDCDGGTPDDAYNYGNTGPNSPSCIKAKMGPFAAPFPDGVDGVMNLQTSDAFANAPLEGLCLFNGTINVDASFGNALVIDQKAPASLIACMSLTVGPGIRVEVADFQFPTDIANWNMGAFCYGSPPCSTTNATITSDKFSSCCGPLGLLDLEDKVFHFSAGLDVPFTTSDVTPDAGIENFPQPPPLIPASTLNHGCSVADQSQLYTVPVELLFILLFCRSMCRAKVRSR